LSVDSFATIVQTNWRIDTFTTDSIAHKLMFDKPGLFDIHLMVQDSWGCKDSVTISAGIEAIELLANFKVDTLGCTNQDLVYVPSGDGINTSTYIWDLGDGTIDSNQVAKHRYQKEGIYNVCLTLKDRRGCENTICKDTIIKVNNPKADFTGDKLTETCPPLLTNFTNNSTNAISYQWDFGDNSGMSPVDRPSHVYLEPDSFDVTLIAIRSETCRDTLRRREYIKLLGPVAKVNYDITSNCLPLNISFNATSDKLYQYIWDFGNGIIDSSQTVTDAEIKKYAYNKAGIYDPKLLVTDVFGCQRSFSLPSIVANEIKLAFEANDSSLCGIGAELELKNKTTSTDQNIFYTWRIINKADTLEFATDTVTTSLSKFGFYDIFLSGETTNCRDTLVSTGKIALSAQPIPDFISDSLLCVGSYLNFKDASTAVTGEIDSVFWFIDDQVVKGKDASVKLLKVGSYDLRQLVKTNEDCYAEKTVSIDVKDNLIIELGKDTLVCQGEFLKLTNILDPTLLMTWTQDNIVRCEGCTELEIFPTDTTIIGIRYSNINGCISEDSILINLAPEPSPVADLGIDTTVCLNSTVVIKVQNYNPTYTYEWPQYNQASCLPNCQGIQFKALEPINIINKVTNSFGCFTYNTLAVSIESGVPDFLPSNKSICEGDDVVLKVPSSLESIAWVLKNDTICRQCDSISLKPLKSENYTLIVKSENQCLYKDSVNIELIKPSTIDAGKDFEICKGEELNIQGKGIGNGHWSLNGDTVSSSSVLKFFPQITGDYILKFQKDECSLTDTMNILVLEKVSIQAEGDTICYGDAIYLKAQGDAFIYNWLDASGKVISTNKIDSLLGEKTLNLTLVGKRTTCQSDSIKLVYKVQPPIDYSVNDDEIKIYYNTKHFVSATYDPIRQYSYQWFPDYPLSCNDCPEPIISNVEQTELFQVIITDDETGCMSEVFFNAELDKNCSEKAFIIPNVFKPGSANDVFELKHGFIDDFNSITIMDRWGNKVFQSNDLSFKWDGKYNGQVLNPGVYIYVISANCAQKNNEPYQFGGDITILR
jgi:gliding motility-associated-like protein